MTNTIGIVWTSDQRQVIADFNKRNSLLEAEINKLKTFGAVGKDSGSKLGSAYREATNEISRLGKLAESSFKQTLSPMDAHLKRMQDYRALLRMGKIDQDQFRQAQQQSLKSYFDDSGQTDRLRQQKAARAAMLIEGKRLTDQFATSQERFNIKLAAYRNLLKSGAIDQRAFGRAVAETNPELERFVNHTAASSSGVGSLMTGLSVLASGLMSVAQAARFVANANREAQHAAEEAALKQEQLLIRYRAQAGLNEVQGAEAKKSIMKNALITATTSVEASGAATAMVSTGFDASVAQGSGLLPFLKLLKAQALDPAKATGSNEMAEAFSQFLSGSGQAKSGENVEKLAVAIQGLKATPLKVTDLAQLAKHASTLNNVGGMNADEMLSNFAFLRGNEDAESAGTHLRELVRQLATAGGNKKATEQLAEMGMMPEDVDFVGEDFATVMDRVKKGMARLSPEQQKIAADTLVEGRNMSALFTLMDHQGDVADLRQLMGDKAGFEADFQMTSTGKNATDVRQDLEAELLDSARDLNTKRDRKSFQNNMKKSDGLIGQSPALQAAATAVYDTLDFLSGHEAHVMTFGEQEDRDRMQGQLNEADRERHEAKEIIRAGREGRVNGQPIQINVAPPPAPIVNVQVQMPGLGEKPGPVPAAGLQRRE